MLILEMDMCITPIILMGLDKQLRYRIRRKRHLIKLGGTMITT